MSSIVTFYSYKGGVGRSMALANTAVLLARYGKRVLVVDWDLEAPGLERYFSYFRVDTAGAGLLNLLIDSKAGKVQNYQDYLWTVRDESSQFSFLASGKDADPHYASKLEAFDWQDFFREGGGDTMERLRDRWKTDYDVVLIDSRTGLSDTGGICTIQLPDVVVAMFTPNHQSLYGVRDVMKLAQSARQSLAYDRAKLSVVPLPSRFGNVTEFRESREWIERSAEAMTDFYADWTPAWASPLQIAEKLKLPQIDYFGFGEKLAVVEHGVNDPGGLGFVYDCLARLLGNELRDADKVLALTRSQPVKRASSATDGYEFDVFVSYDHFPITEEWLREFILLLSEDLERHLGRPPKVFFDYTELPLGLDDPRGREAMKASRVLLMFITRRYFTNSQWRAEFLEFSKDGKEASIFPILVEPVGDLPSPLSLLANIVDLRDEPDFAVGIIKGTLRRRLGSRVYMAINQLSERISRELLTGTPSKH